MHRYRADGVRDARTSETILDDGHTLSSSQIYEYLSNVMYSKRSKHDPYWNAFLVAGLENGEPCVPTAAAFARDWLTLVLVCRFLSYVDLLGTTYSAPSLATGYGNHLAQPLLRRALEKLGPDGHKELSEDAARDVIQAAMKVLFYRDARSLNKVRSRVQLCLGATKLMPSSMGLQFQIATVTVRGVEISEPMSAPTEWGFAEGLRGCASLALRTRPLRARWLTCIASSPRRREL